MVVLTKSGCTGGPGTEGKAAAWVSLAGRVAACKRQSCLGLHAIVSTITF